MFQKQQKKPNLLIPAQPFSIHSMRTEMIIQNVVDWLGLLMKLILIVFSTVPRRNPETMISRSRSPHCTSSKNNSGHKHHEGKSSGGGAETSYTNSRKSKEWAKLLDYVAVWTSPISLWGDQTFEYWLILSWINIHYSGHFECVHSSGPLKQSRRFRKQFWGKSRDSVFQFQDPHWSPLLCSKSSLWWT